MKPVSDLVELNLLERTGGFNTGNVKRRFPIFSNAYKSNIYGVQSGRALAIGDGLMSIGH